MVGDGLYSRPETWQMIYGLTGANDSRPLRQRQPLQAGRADRHGAGRREVRERWLSVQHRLEQHLPERRRRVAARAEGRVPEQDPQQGSGVPRRVLADRHQDGHQLLRRRLCRQPGPQPGGYAHHHDGHAVPADQQQQPGPAARRRPDLHVRSAGAADRRVAADACDQRDDPTSTIRTGRCRRRTSTASASSGSWARPRRSTSATSGTPSRAPGPPGTWQPRTSGACWRARTGGTTSSAWRRRTFGRTSRPSILRPGSRTGQRSPTRARPGPRRSRSPWRTSRGTR